jgi:hypothetical protein
VTRDQEHPDRPHPHGAADTGPFLSDGARRAGALLGAVAGTTRRVAHGVPRVAGAVVSGLAVSGSRAREQLERAAAEAARDALRWAAEAALTALDVTRLVRAHVDLDALAAGIDVDAVVARADLDAAVARVDLDAAVARVDVDAVVARVDVDAVLDALDLDAVMARIDLDALLARIDVDTVVARVDLNQVAARLDLDAVASRVDLEALVGRIDPDALVARVDIDALLARLDLVTLTRSVLEAIDLPQILRESSGAVSSQAARVVRTEGMHADDSVSRWVDRVLRRGHPGAVVTP